MGHRSRPHRRAPGPEISAIGESTSLTGLTPGTTDDFQIVATNTAHEPGWQSDLHHCRPADRDDQCRERRHGHGRHAERVSDARRPGHDVLLPVRHDNLLWDTGPGHTGERRVRKSRDCRVDEPHWCTRLARLMTSRSSPRTPPARARVETLYSPLPVLPSATTSAATGISDTAATLNGLVNPNGLATTYYFQVGHEPPLMARRSRPPPPPSGRARTRVAEWQALTGLTPNTTYDFRIVAVNSDGQVTGSDLTFTSAGLPGAQARQRSRPVSRRPAPRSTEP